MIWLYNLVLFGYYTFVKLVSPFHSKAKQFTTGRKATMQWLKQSQDHLHGCIFFHVSSLGEFEHARPILEALKQKDPQRPVVLSFYSPSGYEIRKNYPLANQVIYLPYDTAANTLALWKALKPSCIIWVKYDFWYHHILEAKKQNIPLVLVCANFRADHIFFKPYGALFRTILEAFDQRFVQNQASADLLQNIGLSSTVAPDTRFDRVFAIAQTAATIPIVETFKGNSPTLVCGSTWSPDETILHEILLDFPQLKIIIAPHHIDADSISKTKETFGSAACLFSQAQQYKQEQVLIIDNIGMLASLYRYGDIAYIGGGFGASVHNILEAAVYGIPLISGPHIQRSAEAIELKQSGGLNIINNSTDLKKILHTFLNEPTTRKQIGDHNTQYIREHLGGTQSILTYLEHIL